MAGVREKQNIDRIRALICDNVVGFIKIRGEFTGYGKNLSVRKCRILYEFFQLTELMNTIGSPVSPVEDKQDILFACKA